MTAKEKLTGLIIILIGALPFLLKIESIKTSLGKTADWLTPGSTVYQVIIIILGFILIIGRKYPSYSRGMR